MKKYRINRIIYYTDGRAPQVVSTIRTTYIQKSDAYKDAGELTRASPDYYYVVEEFEGIEPITLDIGQLALLNQTTLETEQYARLLRQHIEELSDPTVNEYEELPGCLAEDLLNLGQCLTDLTDLVKQIPGMPAVIAEHDDNLNAIRKPDIQ